MKLTDEKRLMIEEFYDNSSVRRSDRLLDAQRAEQLLSAAEYGVLSMVDEVGMAYGVPLNFVWDGAKSLYAHCAKEGRKLRAIALNPAVSFCVVGNVTPQPENLTTLYESIVVTGNARVDLPEKERQNALRLLVKKFAPLQLDHAELSIERSFHRTEVIRIDIDKISGKAKRAKK